MTTLVCRESTFSKNNLAAENRPEFSAFRYRAAIRQYSGSISTPMLLRPVRRAASIVVPAPQKGSSTASSVNENIRTSRVANSMGKGATHLRSLRAKSCRCYQKETLAGANGTSLRNPPSLSFGMNNMIDFMKSGATME